MCIYCSSYGWSATFASLGSTNFVSDQIYRCLRVHLISNKIKSHIEIEILNDRVNPRHLFASFPRRAGPQPFVLPVEGIDNLCVLSVGIRQWSTRAFRLCDPSLCYSSGVCPLLLTLRGTVLWTGGGRSSWGSSAAYSQGGLKPVGSRGYFDGLGIKSLW